MMLFNIVFFAATAASWAPSMLFTIPKKGDLFFPKNWRGIQMCGYLNAWYDRILTNRIKLWMSIDEMQTAYQKGKSCNTQLFTLRTITELGKKRGIPIFITFIDLEKAFDRVRRTTMLKILSQNGMGYNMLNAIKNLYSNTKVILNKIGSFRTSAGIRQGASSSAYIFIILINGLFKYLRDMFADNIILGKIHNLIHADDTVILDTTSNNLKSKVKSTIEFFQNINQNINSGKTKYMIVDSKGKHLKEDLVINDIRISYSATEKYLGHFITDDNSMQKSLEIDIKERGANVLVKFRNFVNNHPTATLEICLKVFQACFTSTILSNCETWGPWIPRKVSVLYNQGLKLALGVRVNTPTVLVYLESRQPYVHAIIRKRQYNFWTKLDKNPDTEKFNLINRANDTVYIKHYRNLENKYNSSDEIYNKMNNEFYEQNWKNITDASDDKTKLKTYLEIYDNCETLPATSLSLMCNGRIQQKILSKYIMSSHNLQSEKGRWSKTPKAQRVCKQCTSGTEETLLHFICICNKFRNIRQSYENFPTSERLGDFFKLENCANILNNLHSQRTN